MAYPRPAGGFAPPGYGAPAPGGFPPQYGQQPQPGMPNAFPPQAAPQPQPMMSGGFPQQMGGPKIPGPGMPAPQPQPMMGGGGFPPRGPASLPQQGGFPPAGGPVPGGFPAAPAPGGFPPSSFPAQPQPTPMSGLMMTTGAGAAPRPPSSMGGPVGMSGFPGAPGPAALTGPSAMPGPRPGFPAQGGPGAPMAGGFPPQGQPQGMPQQQPPQPQAFPGAPRPGFPAAGPGAAPVAGGFPPQMGPGPAIGNVAARPPFGAAPGPSGPSSFAAPPTAAGPAPGGFPAGPAGPMGAGPRPAGFPAPTGAPGPMQPQQLQQQPQPMASQPRPGFPAFPGGPGPAAPMANGPFPGAPQQQNPQPMMPQQPQPMQPQPGPFGAGPVPTPSSASSSFPSSAPSHSSAPSFGAPPGPSMGYAGPSAAMTMGQQAPSVPLAEVNEAHQCRPAYMSLSVGAIPATKQVLSRSSLPFGLAVHPLAEGEGSLGPQGIPLVNFGSAGVVRCKKCRAYLNPFVRFIDGGRRWRCNLCAYCNDTPQSYFAPTDNEGNRVDAASRPELSSGSVEFLASSEYMMRPPQPPVYLFVLDCTYGSVASGVLSQAVETIRACLDRLPGNDRTQVGFITYDSAVHFYHLKATLKAPQQLVVSDLSELFVPLPDDLLVNLAESRPLVDTLLSNLPNMFANTRTSDSCLGSALDAAFQCIQHIGGKLVVLSTSLPSVGPGKLKQREMPKMLGSEKEHTLLAPDAGEDGAFYKNKAVDFSRQQISCDTFLFGSIGGGSSGGYVDVATVGALSRYTAGQCYYYGPTYLPNIDGPRFAADLKKDLLRTTGFESVMRIRCSKGVTISNFYGNFFIRGTDLLALPNVTPGTAFNVELALETEEAAGASQGGAGGGGGSGLPPGSTISIQAALLYTATNGERRICVHTLCKPVTTLVTDLYKGVDVDSLASMYAKVALDHALRQGLHLARRYLHTSLVDLVRAYRAATSPAYGSGGGPAAGPMGHGPRGPVGMGMSAPGATQAALQQQAAMQGDVTAMLPENLQLLPLYILALMKSPLYRGGDAIKSDERSALVYRMLTMPVSFSRLFVYPRLYGLHDFDEQCGRPDPQPSFPSPLLPGQSVPHPADIELQQPPVVLPPALNLTAERLSTEGVYLLDSGCDLYLWCGRAAPQQLLMALFGVPSLDGVDLNNLTLQPQGNDYSHRVLAIVNTLRTYSAASVAGQQQKLRIVREGSRDVNEQRFHWFLVEDKQPFPGGDKSYGEYLPIVARDSHASAMAGVGMGGVGAVGPGGGLGY